MADEKLEEASRTFEMILRTDPNDVEAMLKLGYSRFHLDDYSESMRVYDKVLDIDITNSEAWNLKSLVFYEKKNFAKALDSVEKALDSEPTYDMAWYNKACYLSLMNQIPDSLESLKRSIEIDVKNARKAVKDKDFVESSWTDMLLENAELFTVVSKSAKQFPIKTSQEAFLRGAFLMWALLHKQDEVDDMDKNWGL